MTVALIVTVDTEEEFDWTGVGTKQAWSLKHVAHLGWFQELCETYGVKPTYVIDYPFATAEESIAALKPAHERGACGIGAHPHPWVNPPLREERSPRNSYLSNLPLDLQQEKVGILTEAIRLAFGHQPRTFKAGRYGFDSRLAPYLSSLGYDTDTSVMPFCNFDFDGGPDYRFANWQPYWLPIKGKPERTFLEVPCTSGFNRWPFEANNRLYQRMAAAPFRWFRLRGIFDRLKLLRQVVLSPELASEDDCLVLMRHIARQDFAVLNITLHSPSVMVGGTPFVRNEDDLQQFRHRLKTLFQFATRELQSQPMTVGEFHDHFLTWKP